MARKLLIVGGDSLTDPNYLHYRKGKVRMWWELLAEKNNWDVIFTGSSASCSDYISNKTMDLIIENQHRDIIVTTVWSRGYRDSFADTLHLILEYGQRGWKDPEINFMKHITSEIKNDDSYTMDEFMTGIYFKSLRAIWKLHDFCKIRDIPFYHAQGGWTFLIRDLLKVQVEGGELDMTQNSFFTGFNKHRYYTDLIHEPNFAGWDYSLAIDVIQKDYNMTLRNPHPNQKGHEHMANVMQSLIDGKRPEPNIKSYMSAEKIS